MVGAGVLAGVGLMIGWLAYSLNGGWPLPHTDPDDPRVEAAHARWAPAWEERHAAMVAELEAAGLVVLSVREVDSCQEGETNWKRRDPHGLWCTLTWEALLRASAGDPTGTVTAVHEMARSRSDPSAGPDGLATLLSNLESYDEESEQIGLVSYYGRMSVDGEDRTVRLEAYATRSPDEYVFEGPRVPFGGVVRAESGSTTQELERIQQEWVRSPGPLAASPWLVRLTEHVDYFAR